MTQVSPTYSSTCTSELNWRIEICARVMMFRVECDSSVVLRMSEHLEPNNYTMLKVDVGFSWRARRQYLILLVSAATAPSSRRSSATAQRWFPKPLRPTENAAWIHDKSSLCND